MLYNPKDHPIHKLAARILGSAKPILDDLAQTTDAAVAPELSGKSRTLEAPASRLEALLAVGEGGDQPSLLDDLFNYRLDPPPVPEPPPVVKPKRPVLSAEEVKARKEARKARFSNPAPLPMRATRTTEKLKEDQEAEIVQQAGEQPAEPDSSVALNGRRRTRSGAPSADTVSDASPSKMIVKQKRPQKGIVGLAPYSPLTEGERRRREGQMEIVVDHVDEQDHFKRFNVGWVLPEGLKRGGRAAQPPVSAVSATSRRSRGASQASSGGSTRTVV